MDAKELAAKLNGRKYCREMTREESEQAAAAGLVVVHGASDDLIEFRGAIRDEGGAPGVVLIDAKGLLPERDQIDDDGELIDYFNRQPKARKIEALFAKEGDYTWTYKTDIPHETFEIVEDGEPYCRGIVFNIGDISPL